LSTMVIVMRGVPVDKWGTGKANDGLALSLRAKNAVF
jgi:hypothetical protein